MIKKIIINNFRTIKHIELVFNNLGILVGPNNVGKTTIFEALDKVLGEKSPGYNFDSNDFHDPQINQISIVIIFDKSVLGKNLRCTNTNQICTGEIIKFKFIINNKNGDIDYDFYAYNEESKEFIGNKILREKINFIYIPANRDLKKQMYFGRTIWSKILKECNNDFKKNKDQSENFQNSMIEPIKILEKNEIFQKFKKNFLQNTSQSIRGLDDDFDLSFQMYDTLDYLKTLGISIKNTYDVTHNVERMGYGTQNIISIALFQTYAQVFCNRVILAIEEPESFLGPHLQMLFFKNLLDLSINTQVLYSTHSTNFVRPDMGDKIQILYRDDDGNTNIRKSDPKLTIDLIKENWHKTYTHFNQERNELFFAKKNLLVEGNSDKILIETLCDKHWDINLAEKGISIIECAGKTSLYYFVMVCKLHGLSNYFAMYDKDDKKTKKEDKENNDKVNKKLEGELDKTRRCIMTPNLETELGIDKSGGSKIENAYNWACDNNDHPSLISIKKFLEE